MNTSITREESKTCVGEGWHDILDKIYDYLEELYAHYGIVVTVSQVKEKFGGLRFYIDILNYGNGEYDSDMIYYTIMAYESESYKTCEDCGKSGSTKNVFGWTKTLCDECYAETVNERN